MATAKELRELKVEDLEARAQQLREELFQDLLKLRTGTLESSASRTRKRKDLARVLTVLTSKKAPPAA